MIFQKVKMPGLLLTKLKVKKSKQAIQDAFSALNQNMFIVDRNLKDLLFLVKDLSQILYILIDTKFSNLTQGFNQSKTKTSQLE